MAAHDSLKNLFREPAPAMTKLEKTAAEAKQIIDGQNARRAELTAGLKAQRLAREATEKASTSAKKTKKA